MSGGAGSVDVDRIGLLVIRNDADESAMPDVSRRRVGEGSLVLLELLSLSFSEGLFRFWPRKEFIALTMA